MDKMDPSTFATRASLILTGLGFNKKTIHKKTKDMSGGWRMRVALAKALFVKPSLLLLDDPTAHLDLEACVWLEEYLKKWERTLVLVSHSMDFLNGVCSNMIDMRQKQLQYYGGNYDSYNKTRSENETNQMKAYTKQQEEIAHIKKFIASAGTYANLVRQAKSRQKILDKMEADGFIQPVVPDRSSPSVSPTWRSCRRPSCRSTMSPSPTLASPRTTCTATSSSASTWTRGRPSSAPTVSASRRCCAS